MLSGEIVSGGDGNPMAIVFSCFLPAALWMIAEERNRDALEISALTSRVDQLEEAQRPALGHANEEKRP